EEPRHDDRSRAAGDRPTAEGRAVGRSDQPRQGVGAPRLRNGAARQQLLAGTAADDPDLQPRSRRDPDAAEAHRRGDPTGAAGDVQEIFPDGPDDRGDADAGRDEVTARSVPGGAMFRDLRYAVRTLVQHKGSTLVIVVSIALGIG